MWSLASPDALVSALFGVIDAGQNYYNFRQEIQLEKSLHREDIDVQQSQRGDALSSAKFGTLSGLIHSRKLLLLENKLEYMMHAQSLDAELRSSKTESERDLSRETNNQVQTILLCSTVVLSGSVTLLVEGDLDVLSDETMVVFALFGGAGFTLLLLSIVSALIDIKIISTRMGKRANINRRANGKYSHLLRERMLRLMSSVEQDQKELVEIENDIADRFQRWFTVYEKDQGKRKETEDKREKGYYGQSPSSTEYSTELGKIFGLSSEASELSQSSSESPSGVAKRIGKANGMVQSPGREKNEDSSSRKHGHSNAKKGSNTDAVMGSKKENQNDKPLDHHEHIQQNQSSFGGEINSHAKSVAAHGEKRSPDVKPHPNGAPGLFHDQHSQSQSFQRPGGEETKATNEQPEPIRDESVATQVPQFEPETDQAFLRLASSPLDKEFEKGVHQFKDRTKARPPRRAVSAGTSGSVNGNDAKVHKRGKNRNRKWAGRFRRSRTHAQGIDSTSPAQFQAQPQPQMQTQAQFQAQTRTQAQAQTRTQAPNGTARGARRESVRDQALRRAHTSPENYTSGDLLEHDSNTKDQAEHAHEYFEGSMRSIGRLAALFFGSGTASLVVALLTLMHESFIAQDVPAAAVGIVGTASTIFLLGLLLIFAKFIIRSFRTRSEDKGEEVITCGTICQEWCDADTFGVCTCCKRQPGVRRIGWPKFADFEVYWPGEEAEPTSLEYLPTFSDIYDGNRGNGRGGRYNASHGTEARNSNARTGRGSTVDNTNNSNNHVSFASLLSHGASRSLTQEGERKRKRNQSQNQTQERKPKRGLGQQFGRGHGHGHGLGQGQEIVDYDIMN